MKDLVAVWSRGLLSEVFFIFASILFLINLIVWSLIDNDLEFGPSDIKWLLIGNLGYVLQVNLFRI